MVEARICVMFLRSKICRKDGKDHRAWSVVENRRVHDGRVVQRQVLYLGEINDNQKAAWSKAIEVFDEGAGQSKQIALFPEDRLAPVLDCDVVSIRLPDDTGPSRPVARGRYIMHSNNNDRRRVSWARGFMALCAGLATGLGVMASAAEAAPFAYVTNVGSNNVSVIDTATNIVVATIPVAGVGGAGVGGSPSRRTGNTPTSRATSGRAPPAFR